MFTDIVDSTKQAGAMCGRRIPEIAAPGDTFSSGL